MEPIEFNDHKYGVDLSVRDIKVDLAVQRAIIYSRKRKIIAHFQEILLGELLISERPDGYYVLDGQHRLEAAIDYGLETLTCEVFTGLTRQDEARLFMGRNDRANIAKVDKDRTLATSGDNETLEIQMAVQAAGFVFVAEQAEDSTFRDRHAAVAIMKDANRKHVEITGAEHLEHVFSVYARIYGNQERPESLLLRAISKLLVSRNEVDEERLHEKLRGIPPQQFTAQAKTRREEISSHRGISAVGAALEVLVEQYNRGLTLDSSKRVKI